MSPPGEERREDKRWPLYIPCTVNWNDRTVQGIICNLSYSGALIGRVDSMPPDWEDIELIFSIEGQEFRLKGQLAFRSVHSGWDLTEDIGIGLFSVRFLKPEGIRKDLSSVFDRLAIPPEPSESEE